jgi:hypothetical protein
MGSLGIDGKLSHTAVFWSFVSPLLNMKCYVSLTFVVMKLMCNFVSSGYVLDALIFSSYLLIGIMKENIVSSALQYTKDQGIQNIILSAFMYGHEVWSVILNYKYLKDEVLMRIFKPERSKLNEEWKESHNDNCVVIIVYSSFS